MNIKKKQIRFITMLAVLSTIVLILGLTPLGYIRTTGVEITLMTIPVIMGAITLGRRAGAILGLIFGITSFLYALLYPSIFSSALLSTNVFYTLILTIVPRVIMGYLCGLIFDLLYRSLRRKSFAYIITYVAGAMLNTVLFVSTLCLLFYNKEFVQKLALDATNLLDFILVFITINAVIEAGVNLVIGTVIANTLFKKYSINEFRIKNLD